MIASQLTLPLSDPLTFTLREAFEKFHRRASHKPSYIAAVHTALTHWERCTANPSISQCSNATMSTFSRTFLAQPLPSKVQVLLRRCRRGHAPSLATLSSLGVTWSEVESLTVEEAYRKIAAQFDAPTAATRNSGLLPTTKTFNAQRRTLEAIFSTLGPAHRGNRYALGILSDVPCCRPEDEDEPDVVYATEDHLNAIYEHCGSATWPPQEQTAVPPGDVWRALFVYIYNVAHRRDDWLNLEKSRVKLSQGVILVRNHKTGKFRAIPINATLVKHLWRIRYCHGTKVFPFPDWKQRLYGTWYGIQDAAGIRVDRPEGSTRQPYYGFHEIRKTSLGEYYGINEHAAQMMGCHSSLETTLKHYVAATKKEGKLRQAVEALPQPAAFLVGSDDPSPSGPQGPPQLRIVGRSS